MKIVNTGKNEYTVFSQKGHPLGTYPTLLEAHKRAGQVNHYMVSTQKKEDDREKLKQEFNIKLDNIKE